MNDLWNKDASHDRRHSANKIIKKTFRIYYKLLKPFFPGSWRHYFQNFRLLLHTLAFLLHISLGTRYAGKCDLSTLGEGVCFAASKVSKGNPP